VPSVQISLLAQHGAKGVKPSRLHLADGGGVPPRQCGNLLCRPTLEESHAQHDALIERDLVEAAQKSLPAITLQDALLRSRAVGRMIHQALEGFQLGRSTAPPVTGQVVGDVQEVRREWHTSIDEARQCPEGPHEHLLGQILGLGRVVGIPGQGSEHWSPAVPTEGLEGPPVTTSSGREERALVALTAWGRHSSHWICHRLHAGVPDIVASFTTVSIDAGSSRTVQTTGKGQKCDSAPARAGLELPVRSGPESTGTGRPGALANRPSSRNEREIERSDPSRREVVDCRHGVEGSQAGGQAAGRGGIPTAAVGETKARLLRDRR
jgi:hypothetical protein